MMGYRCHFLGHDGKIHHSEEFTADNDTAAVAKAQELFTENDSPGFELWRDAKIIYIGGVSVPK